MSDIIARTFSRIDGVFVMHGGVLPRWVVDGYDRALNINIYA